MSTNVLSIIISPREQSLLASKNTGKDKTCCKLMCSQCTPKNIWEEYGLGPPEKRPNITGLKGLSACPPSVSSFGPNEDIPPPNQMHREVRNVVAESMESFARDKLSEVSHSLKYGRLSTPGRSLRSSSTANGISSKVQKRDRMDTHTYRDDSIYKSVTNPPDHVEHGEDEDSCSEYEDYASRRASTRASLKAKKSGKSTKRARKEFDD